MEVFQNMAKENKSFFFMAFNAKLTLSLAADPHLMFIEGFDTAVVIVHSLRQTSHPLYFI